MGNDEFGLDEIEELQSSTVSLPSLASVYVRLRFRGLSCRAHEDI